MLTLQDLSGLGGGPRQVSDKGTRCPGLWHIHNYCFPVCQHNAQILVRHKFVLDTEFGKVN